MTNPQKNKGDAAEREIATIVSNLLGYRVRRKLGAGRADDTGDLDGIPDTTVQIKNWRNVQAAINQSMLELPVQQANAGTTHAVAFIRRPGGRWIAVMNLDQWACYQREATDIGVEQGKQVDSTTSEATAATTAMASTESSLYERKTR